MTIRNPVHYTGLISSIFSEKNPVKINLPDFYLPLFIANLLNFNTKPQ
jgi:hypothetical protein